MRCCSYVRLDIKYKGFRCTNQVPYEKDFCIDHEITYDKDEMTCLGSISSENYRGGSNYNCNNTVRKTNGLCNRCMVNIFNKEHFMNSDSNSLFNELCENSKKYNPTFLVDYFNKVIFTQKQLNSALHRTLTSNNNNRNIAGMILSTKYFPDLFGYDFLFLYGNLSENVLHQFFYKRFLIKTLLESYNLFDCKSMITDPFLGKINKPYYYTKCLLNKILFPCKDFNHERIFPIKSAINDKQMLRPYKTLNDHFIFNNYIIIKYNANSIYYVAKCDFLNGEICDFTDHDIKILNL